MPSVLDEIVAGVREDLIAREAAVPMAQVKAAAAAAASAGRRARGAARARRRGHRRGQAPQPVEGRARRDRRPGAAGPRIRSRWGADRSAC